MEEEVYRIYCKRDSYANRCTLDGRRALAATDVNLGQTFRKVVRAYDADARAEQIEADVKAGNLRGVLKGIDTSVDREEDSL